MPQLWSTDVPGHSSPGGQSSFWRLPWRGCMAASLGVLAGTALQLQQARLWPLEDCVWVGLAGLVLGLGLAWQGDRPGRRAVRLNGAGAWVLVWLLALVLTWAQLGIRAALLRDRALPEAWEGLDIEVIGRVSAMPQRLAWGQRFLLVPESAQWAGQALALPSPLWLGWSGAGDGGEAAVPALVAGERWRFSVRLKRVHGALNPGGFDHELWLWEQGVLATGQVRAGPGLPQPERMASSAGYPVERWRQQVRDAIWRHLLQGAPEGGSVRQAGVVVALVTGDQRAIERADWQVFRSTGVAHLMSISGLHITLLAWLASRAIQALWRQTARWSGALGRACLRWPAPWVASLGGLLVALSYSVFCGWGVPAQRTVGMLAVLTCLRAAGLRWPWQQTWALMAAVVVLWDPWAWLQPGFWLSFVAVGVLFVTDAGAKGPAPTQEHATAWRQALRAVVALLREQWVLTLALAPLTLWLFGQVSVVGLVANLFAIPWVTGVVTPLALLGCLLPPLWDAAAWAVQGLAVVLVWLAAWPGATWSVAAPPLWAGAVGLLGGVMCAGPWPGTWRLLGVPLLLPVLFWQAQRPDWGRFELLAADVGQGNAVIVRTAQHTLVYDAGPRYSVDSDAGDRILLPLLRATGETPDRLVLSHRDTDHTGGAAALLSAFPQMALWSSLAPDHLLLRGRDHTRCGTGQGWQWDGVHFAFLHPGSVALGPEPRPNALSCVLRVQDAHGVAALLPGDIEAPQELALVNQGAPLAADWLLVPHHGSKTSSTPAFLAAVAPRVAVVQVGYRNRFAHPAPEVRERYSARELRWVETPSCGAALWRSQQADTVQCEREHRPRYWHWPLRP